MNDVRFLQTRFWVSTITENDLSGMSLEAPIAKFGQGRRASAHYFCEVFLEVNLEPRFVLKPLTAEMIASATPGGDQAIFIGECGVFVSQVPFSELARIFRTYQ